jgi:hypothetical protein
MPKLLVPNNIECTIGGIEVSNFLISANGSWSSIAENGLLVKTGEIELTTPPNSSIGLLSFRVGVPITLLRNGLPVPILNGMYVDSVQQNESATTLSIKTSCRLALHAASRGASSVLCLKPDQTRSAQSVITTLLNAAGIPNAINGIDGTVRDIQVTMYDSNLVSLAGEIALAKGHFLYTDHDGIVKSQEYGNYSEGLTLGRQDLLRYDQSVESGLPARVFEISTEETEKNETELSTSTQTSQPGELTTTSSTISNNGRTVTNLTQTVITDVNSLPVDIWGPSFGSVIGNRSTIVEQYESDTRNLGECVVEDPGRLTSRLSTLESAFGIAFEGWIRSAKLAEENLGIAAPSFPLGTVVIFEQTTESWSYDYELDNPVPKRVPVDAVGGGSGGGGLSVGGASLGDSITRTVETIGRLGQLVPWGGDPSLGRPGESSQIILSPSSIVKRRVVRTSWQRSKDKRSWAFKEQTLEPRIISDPEGVQALRLNPSIPLSTVIAEATRMIVVKNETKTVSSPDEPSRAPSLYSYSNKPVVYFHRVASSGELNRSTGISIAPNIFNNDSAPLIALAKTLNELAWYRYYSFTCVSDGELLPTDIRPLSKLVVNYPGGDPDVLLMDAISVLVTPKELTFATNGLLFSKGGGLKVYEEAFASSPQTNEVNPNAFSLFGLVDGDDNYILVP